MNSFSHHDANTEKAIIAIIRRGWCNIILFSQPNLVITINQIDWPFGFGQIKTFSLYIMCKQPH